jgi:hypothetical protein
MPSAIAKKNMVAGLYLTLLHVCDLIRLYVSRSNNEMGYYNLLFSIAIAAHPKVILDSSSTVAGLDLLENIDFAKENQGLDLPGSKCSTRR